MNSPTSIDLSGLPEQARREVYDFYLFIKQRSRIAAAGESALLSESCLAEDWPTTEEDLAWRDFQ